MASTPPMTAIQRLERIRKIAESIRCTEGGELDSLLANITGAVDLGVAEIHRLAATQTTTVSPL